MAQLIVRNLDDALKERLRRVAASHGRSMEEEVRTILHRSLAEEPVPTIAESHVGLGSRIHAGFMDADVPDSYFDAVESLRGGAAPGVGAAREAEFDA